MNKDQKALLMAAAVAAAGIAWQFRDKIKGWLQGENIVKLSDVLPTDNDQKAVEVDADDPRGNFTGTDGKTYYILPPDYYKSSDEEKKRKQEEYEKQAYRDAVKMAQRYEVVKQTPQYIDVHDTVAQQSRRLSLYEQAGLEAAQARLSSGSNTVISPFTVKKSSSSGSSRRSSSSSSKSSGPAKMGSSTVPQGKKKDSKGMTAYERMKAAGFKG